MGLSPKRARFVAEYLVDLNATRAAERAGYSKKTANEQGARLLANVSVRAAVAAKQKKVADELELDAKMVLRDLLAHARADIRKAYDKDGRMLPVHQLPDDVAIAVTSVKSFEEWGSDGDGGKVPVGDVREARFSDKLRALELLGKHLKLFTDKVEHEAGESLEALLLESMSEGPKK